MSWILSYKLEPPKTETLYREEIFWDNRKQSLLIGIFGVSLVLLFAILDIITQPFFKFLNITLVIRMSVIAVSITAVSLLWRIKSAKTFDIIGLVWTLLFFLHMLLISYLRTDDYITLILWDIVAIFAVYFAIPSPLFYQMTAGIFLTVGSMFLWLVVKSPSWQIYELVSIIVVYICSNILGIFVSRQLKRSRRARFTILLTERDTRQRLESAISEIKTLQGILPICSFCRKVRNDKGYWDKLEEYITEHTSAQLSHSLCPDCLKEHYPDVYTSMKNKKKE